MNNSSQPDFLNSVPGFGPRELVLSISGIPPAFKNNKMLLTRSPSGKPLDRPLLITKPEYQKAMQKITESFVYQLISACQTEGGETLTGCSLRSAIACCTPADDSWTHIPEIHLSAELCAPGDEGVTVTLERL